MEYAIFFTVVFLNILKFREFVREYRKNPEPEGPFWRQREREWEWDRVQQILEFRRIHDANQGFEEKVNWKDEGF